MNEKCGPADSASSCQATERDTPTDSRLVCHSGLSGVRKYASSRCGTGVWEALEDEYAKRLILESLLKYQTPVSRTLEEREKSVQNRVRERIIEVLNAESGVGLA